MKSLLKNKKITNQSGIALVTAIVAVVATTAIVGFSLFGFLFSDKDKEENEEVANVKTKIQEEISDLNLSDDRDYLYDFEVEPILKKYGTINYNWRKKIKSITLSDGTTINIKDIYSGDIKKSSVKEQYEGGVYNISAKIETPKLGEDMVGVYWSDGERNSDGTYKASNTSTKIEVTSDKSGFSWSDWYNYVDSSNSQGLDAKLSRWANAKSKKDGSYFVWIPRFEYKITNEHTNQTGTITVNFISTSQTKPTTSDYKIHPAFIDGNRSYDKGEWDDEISGFWVAKYEMSMETSKNNKKWEPIKAEYIKTSKQGDILSTQSDNNNSDDDKEKTYIRSVSKPNCYAWNYISIGNAYTNSKLYDEENQSHLIKNSEWGAVSYLAHSQYGRNSNATGMNTYYYSLNGFSKLTGFGSYGTSQTYYLNDNNRFNGDSGRNASTTGNLYGVYDMNGGNLEYTAAYFSSHENIKKYGESLSNDTASSKSSKYVTIYPGEKASITLCYDLWKDIYGDAIYETSSACGYYNSWFTGNIDVDSEENEPFFTRGGSYRDASQSGLFTLEDNTGVKYYQNNGFRVILIPQ